LNTDAQLETFIYATAP